MDWCKLGALGAAWSHARSTYGQGNALWGFAVGKLNVDCVDYVNVHDYHSPRALVFFEQGLLLSENLYSIYLSSVKIHVYFGMGCMQAHQAPHWLQHTFMWQVHSWTGQTGRTLLLQYNSHVPKPDLDLFLLCYLRGSVVLSSLLQAWVRPETRPLLCQWNGRQEQGWCAKPGTWLPEEITWQKLKHQTCRNVCFEIPETWLSLWFFGMLWFSRVGWKQSVTLQGHWEYYPLCSHGICEAN